MSTVYVYADLRLGKILALPTSENPANDPPLLSVVRRMTQFPGATLDVLTDDQVESLVGMTFTRINGGSPPPYDQVVFYDGADYGKQQRRVIHTRQF